MKLILVIFFGLPSIAFLGKEATLDNKRLLIYAPEFMNAHNFSIEFGFITDKNIGTSNYHYNAFAKAFIAGESQKNSVPGLRSASLGAKLGVILPTQKWIPIYLESAFGFAKTALQKRPWFGKSKNNVDDKDMFLAEAALIYLYNKQIIYRISYQINNVNYFKRDLFFSIGSNY